MPKSIASGYGNDQDVLRAAYRWREARMAATMADAKADHRSLWSELGNAEDALSKAVMRYEENEALIPILPKPILSMHQNES